MNIASGETRINSLWVCSDFNLLVASIAHGIIWEATEISSDAFTIIDGLFHAAKVIGISTALIA